MCPRRPDRARKSVNPMEARVEKAISATSFSKPPPAPMSLPETAQFFFQHLPSHSRGGPRVAANEAWERKTAVRNSIYEAYLRALARLPFNGPDGAPTMPSLLPALLAGGHCFGPLANGASNVIVNTVWIHAASSPARFAAADTVVDVVDLNKVQAGSLAGLTRVQPLDDDAADHNYDYYYAAAVAAKHPNCEAFAAFAQSGVATSPAVTELLANSSALLSNKDIERLAALLVPRADPPLHGCVEIKAQREELMRTWQARRRKLANMAIDHWNRIIGGPELQLKVVCAASIGDPDYQHINFMATPRDNPAATQLFFAEHAKQIGVVLCCPVQDSVSRSGHCSLCEGLHQKIIHPPFGVYNFRSPLDATFDIIDFDIANLLDIKYARHLWGSRHMVSSGYTIGTCSSSEWVNECDVIIFR